MYKRQVHWLGWLFGLLALVGAGWGLRSRQALVNGGWLLPAALLLPILLILAVLAGGLGASQTARGNAASPFLYPYNQGTSITFNINDLTQSWTEWKSAQITATNAGGGGLLRVMGGVTNSTTVSEGMSYGILFASIFDDQATLDGLWRFTRDHLDSQGLMHWYIGNPGQLLGSGAATDADEDIALGMLLSLIHISEPTRLRRIS